ncbi:hypothetical protein [Streptomyces sp. B1I3]|uniref:hypothetical protein n=1 Tax=Streptomyces sp. B1I3 TaxID=3042264 RepID=UPI002780E666|nr:hypothetical protein [Streptomyces sp. B1I3]MDQ0793580.1 hypothetical protein [Streptomyces sp. B1I3]
MTNEMKNCGGECGETKPVTEFYVGGTRKNESIFYLSRCKVCHRKAVAVTNMKRYYEDPEERAKKIARAVAFSKKRRAEDPEGDKSYNNAHKAVRREKGSPSEWACVDNCGEQANEWALVNDSESIIRSKNFRWSDDVEDYVAMNASCHRRYDAECRLES